MHGRAHRAARLPSCPLWSSILALALLTAWPAAAQKVIDGDSIELRGQTYNLYGVDAPEADQTCGDGWPAGFKAEEYLDELVAGKNIVCVPMPSERDGVSVAICRADGVDLGAAMVTGGYAYAFVPLSARYISEEAAAAKAQRGLHAHPCQQPWKWRAHERGDVKHDG